MLHIVFTGTFEIDGEHIVRDLLVDVCSARGWTVQKSVDYYTDFLVKSPHGGNGTLKARKAEELGVKIISPQYFWDMVKEG